MRGTRTTLGYSDILRVATEREERSRGPEVLLQQQQSVAKVFYSSRFV